MKAIDLHCHFNHNVEFDTKSRESYLVSLEFLKKERERLNIVNGAFCSFASVLSDKVIEEENEYAYKLAQKDDWFYQWIVVDPRNKNTFIQAEKMLKSKKSLGIKIHSVLHGYDFFQYSNEIFSFATDLKSTVLMHPEDDYERTVKEVNKYPNIKFILAHLGGKPHVDAIKNAKHDNIFVDTSGNASSSNYVIEYAVKEVGSEKIFFGTDTYSCAFQKGRIFFADISDKDKENILYNNAVREFSKNFNKKEI